jgi:hypothetical protein
LGGIQEESQQNRHAQRVEVPIVTGKQQSGATNEPITQSAVRRTRWVNALLLMGCIPQYPEEMG